MKFVLSTLIASLVFTGASFQKGEGASPLEMLVNTERAFAKASRDTGTREAFLSYIASDGILFRPKAVNGRKWLLENAPPPNAKRPLLSWQPIFADISQAGDMGYTTGPWEFRPDIKDAKPSGHGQFVTVWKKQVDGSWKFVVDLGISNAEPRERAMPWQAPEREKNEDVKIRNIDQNAVRVELIKRDWAFAEEAKTKGAIRTLLAYATDDVRLLRNDRYPFVGRDAVKKAFSKDKSGWSSQPDYADIAHSGDLGYTFGTYEVIATEETPAASSEKGNYLRIWKKDGDVWKIVLEVANPLPRN